MTTRADVLRVAQTWLGTRWQHQAWIKGVGTDCIGLVAGVALELGLPEAIAWAADPTQHSYGRDPQPAALLTNVVRFLDPISLGTERPGDILLLRFSREPQHFAILSAPDRIVHAYAQARKVVENRLDEAWRSRIVGAYSYRGLDG
jgi:NlpC/P60 family putative phage cell wall peptidase